MEDDKLFVEAHASITISLGDIFCPHCGVQQLDKFLYESGAYNKLSKNFIEHTKCEVCGQDFTIKVTSIDDIHTITI